MSSPDNFAKVFKMKKSIATLLTLILLTFCTAQSSHSQSNWFWQQPLPSGNFLYSVDFVDEQTGYAVGTVGTVMKTTNGGVNWNVLNVGTNSQLADVFCISINEAIIVGSSGLILRTTNGGQNWNSIFMTSSNLNGIDFPTSNTGYISVFNGTILKSTNSGSNWTQLQTGIGVLGCVSFCDSLHGIAGTFNGVTMTTNGGMNWNYTELTPQPFEAIISASFMDTQNINVLSNDYVYRTSNMGTNWTRIDLPIDIDDLPRTISFSNNNTGYIATSYGSILTTTNGGLNWRNDSTFNPSYYIINVLWGADAVRNSDVAYVSGAGAKIIKTTDGGQSWNLMIGGRYNLESNYFTNETTGYSVGYDGTILKTTNSGQSWLQQESGTAQHLNEVYFTNSDVGYVCGNSGVILKTTNAGMNWNLLSSGVTDNLNGICFSGSNFGVAVSAQSRILRTTNGGDNWDVQIFSPFRLFYSIELVNELTGYIAADGGIYKTTNGGIDWFSNYVINNPLFYSINFCDSLNGIASGAVGRILRTTNAGTDWFYQTSGTTDHLYSIKILSTQSAIAVGKDGTIVYTTNNGNTWQSQITITDNFLSSIFLTNVNTAYIVGNFGTIIKTNNSGLVKIQQVTSLISNNQLYQNYPNPFNPSTKIRIAISKTSEVEIKIHDIKGSEVSTFSDNKILPGVYEYEVDFTKLNSMSTGSYFYSLFINKNLIQTKKMIYLK